MGEKLKFILEDAPRQEGDEQEKTKKPDVASLIEIVRRGGKGARAAASVLFEIDSTMARGVVYPATKRQREQARRERKK